jgi:hypothetical protein
VRGAETSNAAPENCDGVRHAGLQRTA